MGLLLYPWQEYVPLGGIRIYNTALARADATRRTQAPSEPLQVMVSKATPEDIP